MATGFKVGNPGCCCGSPSCVMTGFITVAGCLFQSVPSHSDGMTLNSITVYRHSDGAVLATMASMTSGFFGYAYSISTPGPVAVDIVCSVTYTEGSAPTRLPYAYPNQTFTTTATLTCGSNSTINCVAPGQTGATWIPTYTCTCVSAGSCNGVADRTVTANTGVPGFTITVTDSSGTVVFTGTGDTDNFSTPECCPADSCLGSNTPLGAVFKAGTYSIKITAPGFTDYTTTYTVTGCRGPNPATGVGQTTSFTPTMSQS